MPPADSATGTPGSEPRVVVERPPPGLERGLVAWPVWAVATAGSLVVALGLVYLLWRLRRALRR
jgi:hypothetical protein